MKTGIRGTLLGLAATLLCPAVVAGDDVRELTWDDLLPKSEAPKQLEPRGHRSGMEGGDDDWDWEDDSFEDVFATPAYPIGVVDELDGARVKLPGFIVPVEMVDEGTVSNFLLVPYFGACIHYPAPPPNQIVYVTMTEPSEVASMWEPVWVTGEMRTETRHSDLASASYTMTGDLIEEYEY